MRRFSFYVLITVLTFGVGCFIAFKLFVGEQKQINFQIPKISEPKTEIVQIADIERKIVEDQCHYYNDELTFQPIIKKWLEGEKFKNELYCASSAKKLSSYKMPDTGIVSVWDIVTPTLIDLNGDSKNELALQSGCSGSGNCEMEIFEKTKKSYRKILTSVFPVSEFELKTSRNNGYQDIWAKFHSSGDSGSIVSYRYDGKKYKVLSCFEYYYEQNYGEPVETRAKPKLKLTSVNCSQIL